MTAPSPLRAEAQAHRGAGVTEREARDRIAPRAGTLRGNVLRAVAAAGDAGLTAPEATVALGLSRDRLYSVAPRLSELERSGYLEPGPVRRNGRRAPRRQAYVATDLGRAWAEAHG